MRHINARILRAIRDVDKERKFIQLAWSKLHQ